MTNLITRIIGLTLFVNRLFFNDKDGIAKSGVLHGSDRNQDNIEFIGQYHLEGDKHPRQ